MRNLRERVVKKFPYGQRLLRECTKSDIVAHIDTDVLDSILLLPTPKKEEALVKYLVSICPSPFEHADCLNKGITAKVFYMSDYRKSR